MAKTLVFFVLVISGASSFVLGQADQRQWQVADLATTRLPPTAFPQLPREIAQDLQTRGCTVPQLWSGEAPHNVIRGEFARKGQTDWAVLCSKDRVSAILVFWGGSVKRVSEVAREPDRNFLQIVDGKEKIGFSRRIGAVGEDFILKYDQAYGGPKPPPINHQGIEDIFDGKASTIHYFYDGKWLRLQGAD